MANGDCGMSMRPLFSLFFVKSAQYEKFFIWHICLMTTAVFSWYSRGKLGIVALLCPMLLICNKS